MVISGRDGGGGSRRQDMHIGRDRLKGHSNGGDGRPAPPRGIGAMGATGNAADVLHATFNGRPHLYLRGGLFHHVRRAMGQVHAAAIQLVG
jgi:hypothetical protein